MGPSGSGKTSLLDILASRCGQGRIYGTAKMDNIPISSKHQPSYVAQEDTLLGSFTVRETMLYSASFNLPYSVGLAERQRIVGNLLTDLGLDSCADTIIGDIFRKGISGGQKRRLSLGLALISRPAILLADEPTSGLDAASAYEIFQLLSTLATSKGLCIATTIHQPSSDMWELFDKLCLMSGGNVVYFGKADAAVRYFTNQGYPCPSFSNPADFFLSLINTDFPSHGDVLLLREASRANQAPAIIDDIRVLESKFVSDAAKAIVRRNPNPSWWHFITLSHRNFLATFRNPGVILIRLVIYAMLGIMIGGMFYRNGHKSTDKAIQAALSALFFIFAFMVFMSIAVLPFYMMDRATYFREQFNGDYKWLPFVLAQFLSTSPGIFLIAFVSSICVVFLMSFRNFGMFLLLLFLSLLTAEGFMACVSAVVPHFIIGIAVGAGLYGFFMLCEGFFQVKSDIPPWFIWVYYMGFHTYAFRGSVVNEFKDRGTLVDATNPSWSSGQAVINYLGMEGVPPWKDALVLAGYALAWQLLYYLILLRTRGKR